jgi:hypothetical protein
MDHQCILSSNGAGTYEVSIVASERAVSRVTVELHVQRRPVDPRRHLPDLPLPQERKDENGMLIKERLGPDRVHERDLSGVQSSITALLRKRHRLEEGIEDDFFVRGPMIICRGTDKLTLVQGSKVRMAAVI